MRARLETDMCPICQLRKLTTAIPPKREQPFRAMLSTAPKNGTTPIIIRSVERIDVTTQLRSRRIYNRIEQQKRFLINRIIETDDTSDEDFDFDEMDELETRELPRDNTITEESQEIHQGSSTKMTPVFASSLSPKIIKQTIQEAIDDIDPGSRIRVPAEIWENFKNSPKELSSEAEIDNLWNEMKETLEENTDPPTDD